MADDTRDGADGAIVAVLGHQLLGVLKSPQDESCKGLRQGNGVSDVGRGKDVSTWLGGKCVEVLEHADGVYRMELFLLIGRISSNSELCNEYIVTNDYLLRELTPGSLATRISFPG